MPVPPHMREPHFRSEPIPPEPAPPHAGFEVTHEELAEILAEINRKLDDLLRRVARIEAKLK